MTDQITSSDQIYPGSSLPTLDHIRLLVLQPGNEDEEISCELVVSDLDSAPPYESLSYTWGDLSNRSLINILTPSASFPKAFPITSNCYSALIRLRFKFEPRILWIDALCIDQDNAAEKNHQVGLMSKIYSRAANVVICLGDAGEDSDMAIDFIKECDDPSSDRSSLSYPKTDSLVQALECFFHRDWFTRIWVIQEVMLPTDGIVLYALLPLLPLLHNPDSKSLILPPQYHDSLVKVYTDTAVALLRDCGFEVLRSVQGGSNIDGLPSWVPDWSVPPRRQMLDSAYRVSSSGSVWRKVEVGDVAHAPEVIDGKSMLRVYGHSCGRITKMSSVYRAGEGIFPLEEWSDVMKDDEPALSVDRESVSIYNMEDPRERLRYQFYKTIGAAGFAYDDAIKRFISAEQRNVDESSSDDEVNISSSRRRRPRPRWEDLVHIEASKHREKSKSGDAELPFTDIPFHLAAKNSAPSYKAYVQYVLKNCHSRHFAVTENGFLGLVPDGSKIGDEILLCVGAKIPFVFRKVNGASDGEKQRQFQLLGECCVEEIAWKSLKHKAVAVQEILIV